MRSLILTTILAITTGPVLASLVPPDTKVIPGHGPATDVATLRRFRAFLSDLIAAVAKARRSKQEAVRSISMDQYPEIKPSRTLGNEIAVVYDELGSAR